VTAGPIGGPRTQQAFAHASEAEFARILDYYQVHWEYEPHTFPILWNLDGKVVESFAPDFYLPDLDLHVELTTLRQSLVRKKNRKLRRLRELYPGIRIKLFYARDFRALMLKYGKLDLVGELSGSSGQATRSGGEADPEATEPVGVATPAGSPLAERGPDAEAPVGRPPLPVRTRGAARAGARRDVRRVRAGAGPVRPPRRPPAR